MERIKKIQLFIAGGFVFAICLACGTSGDAPSAGSTEDPAVDPTAAEPADGLTAVPNSNGLRASVPAGVTPNGIGGAAGFHTDDDTFSMRLREDSSGMSIDDARETAQLLGFVRWVRNDETPDGYVLVTESRKLDDQANPTDQAIFMVTIKRNIGTTAYLCEGSANTEENAGHVVESCQSVVGG